MAAMSKDVYKTIKRSITATTNGIAATANGVVSNVINRDSNISRLSNPPKPAARWLHAPNLLRECRVDYVARLWGKTEVSEPKGNHVVRDAILKIRFQYEQNKSIAGHSGSKLPKVILQINAEKIVIVDQKTNKNLHIFPLRRISYSADDKTDKQIFSIIVREDSKFICFVFLSEKLAEEITLTIGQAFDLAYEKYCLSKGENNRKDLENQKQIIMLQKRIRELETENANLRAENKSLKINSTFTNSISQSNTSIPSTPKTPLANDLGQMKIAIAPPPQLPSRRAQQTVTSQSSTDVLFSLNDVFNREKQGPEVGTRLQHLQMDQMEDLFDDEFDPRAGEKKANSNVPANSNVSHTNGNNTSDNNSSAHGWTNNTNTNLVPNSSTQTTTVEDFEALLKQIDERLAIAQDSEGFISESLERGDTGDVGRDFANYNSQIATSSSSSTALEDNANAVKTP